MKTGYVCLSSKFKHFFETSQIKSCFTKVVKTFLILIFPMLSVSYHHFPVHGFRAERDKIQGVTRCDKLAGCIMQGKFTFSFHEQKSLSSTRDHGRSLESKAVCSCTFKLEMNLDIENHTFYLWEFKMDVE